jgi:hypothetical protein
MSDRWPAPPKPRPQGIASSAAAKRSPILTETSWSPRRDLTLANWTRQGRCLGSAGRASGWWLGDWIRYGNARYGEKYGAAARVTGYDVQSLMNMAYVASRFKISRRREKLSFSHHAELAALAPDAQERWLDRAELEGLSLRRLREELRREARLVRSSGAASTSPGARSLPNGASHADRPPPNAGAEVVCPECGHQFHPASAVAQSSPREPPSERRAAPSIAGLSRGGSSVGARS